MSLAPFSHAHHDAVARRELLREVLVWDARRRTRHFQSRTAAAIDSASTGLNETLSRWLEGDCTLAQVRGYPLAAETFRQPALDPVWAAAMSALHLHSTGFDGEWSAGFSRPAPVRWGNAISPPLRGLSVTAQAGEVRLRLTALDGSVCLIELRCTALPTDWVPITSARLGNCRIAVLGGGTEAVLPAANADEYTSLASRDIAATLETAGVLLENHAPAFLSWVTDADWAVAPIRTPGENMIGSFSSRGQPGVPYISFPVDPLLATELLVHETSHIYYHCAQLRAEPCNGNDTALYYSPYVRTERQVDRILIAFHAFANIVLSYRAMLETGLSYRCDVAQAAIGYNLPILAKFGEILRQSRGLTEAGRELFEPLYAQIRG